MKFADLDKSRWFEKVKNPGYVIYRPYTEEGYQATWANKPIISIKRYDGSNMFAVKLKGQVSDYDTDLMIDAPFTIVVKQTTTVVVDTI